MDMRPGVEPKVYFIVFWFRYRAIDFFWEFLEDLIEVSVFSRGDLLNIEDLASLSRMLK